MEYRQTRCAVYIRVSTAEQAMHGKSLEAQTDFLTRYAEEHDMEVVGIFADEGKTARKNFKDRKAIKRLLEQVKRDEIDVILFWKMDRWFRNVSDFYKVQDILEAHGVKWIAAAEPNMSMETREGRLNLNIMLSINQNETDTTSERIRFVNEASVKQGKVITGSQPLGYMVGTGEDGAKRVIKNPETEWLVNEFFQYYLVHQSKRGALSYLVEKYGPVITMRQVDALCKNPLYSGCYRGNPGYCPPYLSGEQYLLLQEINGRNLRLFSASKSSGEVYLFSGLLKCPLCKRPLSANRSEKNNHTKNKRRTVYRYYRCQNWIYKKTCSYSKPVNEASVEAFLLSRIGIAEEKNGRCAGIRLASIVPAAPPAKKEPDRSLWEKELIRLNRMYQKGRITEAAYDSEYERLTEKLNRSPLPPPNAPPPSYEGLKAVAAFGWRGMYEALSRERKRAFWHSLLKEIELEEGSSAVSGYTLL